MNIFPVMTEGLLQWNQTCLIYKIDEDGWNENGTKEHEQKVFVAEKKEPVEEDCQCKEQNINIESNDDFNLPLQREIFQIKTVHHLCLNQKYSSLNRWIRDDKNRWPAFFIRDWSGQVYLTWHKSNMRCNGTWLFKIFGYLTFGVQTYNNLIRQAIVSFMKENENMMKGVMRGPDDNYLETSMKANSGRWGTEIEIFALATTRTIKIPRHLVLVTI